MRVALAVAFAALGMAGAAAAAPAPVVVLDPGHDLRANLVTEPIGPGSSARKIKDGGGTHGVVTGIAEAELVLDVSLRLRALLRRAGVSVVMTRTRTAGECRQRRPGGHREPGRRGAVPARPRRRRPHRGRPGHAHALPGAAPGLDGRRLRRQPERRRDRAGRARAALGFPDRGLQERADFTGFNWADVPVVMVEMGFMTNPTEDRLLATDAVRQRAAAGLCRGTLRFLDRDPVACG